MARVLKGSHSFINPRSARSFDNTKDAFEVKHDTENEHLMKSFDEFTYLESVASISLVALTKMLKLDCKAGPTFRAMDRLWKFKTTGRIFTFNVKTVLLYASEFWTVTRRTLSRLQVFINKCLRIRYKYTLAGQSIANKELGGGGNWRKTNAGAAKTKKMQLAWMHTEEM